MGDSIQDILEEWVFEYHTSGTSPNGVQINFVENAEIFDEELQEEYIDETQPIYEVMIHQESVNEDKEFPDDIGDEEMITYLVTYNVLEDWFAVEPVESELYLSDSEIEILMNKIQENIH